MFTLRLKKPKKVPRLFKRPESTEWDMLSAMPSHPPKINRRQGVRIASVPSRQQLCSVSIHTWSATTVGTLACVLFSF
jgi:hypothetical protein